MLFPTFFPVGESWGMWGGVGAIGSVCGGGEVGRVGVGQCGAPRSGAAPKGVAKFGHSSPLPRVARSRWAVASGQRWPGRGVAPSPKGVASRWPVPLPPPRPKAGGRGRRLSGQSVWCSSQSGKVFSFTRQSNLSQSGLGGR
jgi:hypothetical protein